MAAKKKVRTYRKSAIKGPVKKKAGRPPKKAVKKTIPGKKPAKGIKSKRAVKTAQAKSPGRKPAKRAAAAATTANPAAQPLILVINPGSTSTKVAVYQGDTPLASESIAHDQAQIEKFARIVDQHPMRQQVVLDFLARNKVEVKSLRAVVDRGGLLKPISSGTYKINDAMLQDLRQAKRGLVADRPRQAHPTPNQ